MVQYSTSMTYMYENSSTVHLYICAVKLRTFTRTGVLYVIPDMRHTLVGVLKYRTWYKYSVLPHHFSRVMLPTTSLYSILVPGTIVL